MTRLSLLLVALAWMFVPASAPVCHAQYEPFVAVRTREPGNVVAAYNGVCVGNTGIGSLVLTAYHGVSKGENHEVSYRGSARQAHVQHSQKEYDLTVLLVPGVQIPVVRIAKQSPPDGAMITLHVYDHLQQSRWTPLNGMFRRGNSLLHNYGVQSPAWQFGRGVKQGFSGGAYTHKAELVGIHLAGNQQYGLMATLDQIHAVLAVLSESTPVDCSGPASPAESSLNPNVLYVATSPGCLPCEQFKASQGRVEALGISVVYLQTQDSRLQGKQPEFVPTFYFQGKTVVGFHGIEKLLRDLGLQQPSAPRPPASSPVGSVETQRTPPSVPLAPPAVSAEPAVPVADTLSHLDATKRNPAKEFAWDSLSSWGWAALGGAIAGPVGLAIPIIGRLIHRKIKGSNGKQPSASKSRNSVYFSDPMPIPEAWKQAAQQPRASEEAKAACQIPFPRYLGEADQLRELRQSEGRVAALDALVGMLFDDEVKYVLDTSDSEDERSFVRKLKDRIMDRVDQIAPIATPSKQ